MLTRLIYHSENHLGPFDGKMLGELNGIMAKAIERNRQANITGALIFDHLWFMQILEGERAEVSATLRRIVSDDRHDKVTVMDAQIVDARMFGNWWMGMAAIRGTAQGLLEKHGLGGRFNPAAMTGTQAMMVAVDLAQHGLERELAA